MCCYNLRKLVDRGLRSREFEPNTILTRLKVISSQTANVSLLVKTVFRCALRTLRYLECELPFGSLEPKDAAAFLCFDREKDAVSKRALVHVCSDANARLNLGLHCGIVF